MIITSCMIVACVIQFTNEKYINSNTYFIHGLCDDIIMTLTFATNVLCNLCNTIISHFSCKYCLQLKFSCKP